MAKLLCAVAILCAFFMCRAGDVRAAEAALYWQCVSPNSTHPNGSWCPAGTTYPLPDGADGSPYTATAVPANASHAAGTSVGGLFTIPVARVAGGSGIITNVLWKSTGGSAGTLVLRIWSKNPSNTTCTDNTPFSGSDTDDAYLIGGGPFSVTPAAPAVTTGDPATYGALGNLVWNYQNKDGTPTADLYVCAITVSTDTADENKSVRISLSGTQN